MRRMKLQAGSNLVEFALVLPLLLVLLFGIIDFSLALFDKAVVTNAVREGARNGIVYSDTRPTPDQIKTLVETYCNNKLITFGPATANATATFSGSNSGDTLTVSVQYYYDYVVISKLIPSLQSLNLSATSVMRLE